MRHGAKTRNDADRLNTSVDDDGDVYYEDVSIDYAWQGWIARAYKLEKEKQQKDGIKHAVLKGCRIFWKVSGRFGGKSD